MRKGTRGSEGRVKPADMRASENKQVNKKSIKLAIKEPEKPGPYQVVGVEQSQIG